MFTHFGGACSGLHKFLQHHWCRKSQTGPCMHSANPNHSLVPCYYYLLSADVRCVTTGSSSKIFCLVSEETPHAYNREFRCAFLHSRVNRFCYLFIYFVFNPKMASVHFWPALSLSSNNFLTKWKYIQHHDAFMQVWNTSNCSDLSPLLCIQHWR